MLLLRNARGLALSAPEHRGVRVNTKPRKRNAPRPADKSAPQFLQ
jgi:hypothetical protein